MASSRGNFSSGLQFVTTRKSSKKGLENPLKEEDETKKVDGEEPSESISLEAVKFTDISEENENPESKLLERGVTGTQCSGKGDNAVVESDCIDNEESKKDGKTLGSSEGQVGSEESDNKVIGEVKEKVVDGGCFKKSLVKFTISVESNNEDEDNTVFDLDVSQPSFHPHPDDSKDGNLSRCSSTSSPILRLNLSDDIINSSSPECGNSPEIRHSRARLYSGESSLTSTPTSSRNRRQAFCGGSYMSRRNLSTEQLEDLEDGFSASSSDFSPGSTLSSLGGMERFVFHSVDELSDDGSLEGHHLREFNDESSIESKQDSSLPQPVNKQLRIVTSVDRALNPHTHRRNPSLPKVLTFARSSSENLEHIAFVDFLKRMKVQQYLKHFPPNMSLLDFKMTTEDELSGVYGILDPASRQSLLRAIEFARNEEGEDIHSDTDSLPDFQTSATSPLPSPLLKKCREDVPFGGAPGGLRRLQRTLSEDTKQRRRESMPSTPTTPMAPPAAGGLLSHNLGGPFSSVSSSFSAVSALVEPSNLLRMKSSALGQSAPSLINSLKEPLSRKNSRGLGRKSVVTGPSSSPTLPPRCPSPQMGGGSPHESPRNLSPNQHGHFAFQAIRKCDARRWSFASIPSSGYGTNTPGTGSNVSSRYSSHERLHQFPSHPTDEEFHFLTSHFGSSDNMTASQDDTDLHFHSNMRPRSRSLSSPARSPGVESEVIMLNSVYKERFPKATAQMVEKLKLFIDSNATLDLDQGCDPVLCFLHFQVLELARECLNRGSELNITKAYLYTMMDKVDKLLLDGRDRSVDTYKSLYPLVKQLLLIVSRPLRLLECLEFDPEEFYMLLEAAEGQARQTMKADIPQYIISKLGLAGPDTITDLAPVDRFDSGAAGADDADREETEPEEQEVAALTNKVKTPCEEDYETIKLISNGAYAAVYLVRHKQTRQRFAMKKICKQNLVLRNQIEQVFVERDILSFTDNPFVVSMYCSFETKKHLCMVMEYVEGGDCATLIKNCGSLTFDLARMYFAETVLALEYLHSYGVVHRDLKPDNLLITALGHVKLTDFGLSKIGLMSLTTNLYEDALDKDSKQFRDKQVFGTPQYIAPEVILRQGYGKPVDWWSMGIILFEFLVGCPPFFGDTPEELFSQVVTEEVQWPDEEDWQVRDDAKDLIQCLLQHDTQLRLGTQGAQEVKEHEFFCGVDWETVLRQKAEFVPQLDNDEDTSYFDSRVDRYNHDLEAGEDTEDDGEDILFHSFSSCSPRYTRAYHRGLEPLINDEMRERRRHSSADDFRARVLEKRALERKDSNQSDGSEGSLDMGRRKDSLLSDTTDSHSDRGIKEEEPDRLRPGTEMTCSVSDSSQTDSDSCQSPQITRHKPPVKAIIPKFAISSEEDKPASPKELSPVDESKENKEKQSSHKSKADVKTSLQKSVSANALTLIIAGNANDVTTPKATISPGGSSASSRDGSPSRDTSPLTRSLKPPIILKRGARGFGFSFRSVRVYIGESNVYTLQHIVTEVIPNSPSFEAGLRADDLITHINEDAVQSLLHTQVVHLLSSGNMVNIRAVPLDKTTIREGTRRKGGKMARRSAKKKQHKEKAAEKKKNRTLFRRLSNKKAEPLYTSHGTALHQPGRQQFTPLNRSCSSGDPPAKRSPPAPWSPDSSLSSTSSSPCSSAPDSPATAHLGRPSSLHVVKHKKTASLKSPHRRKSVHNFPLSPLARTPSPSAVTNTSPARSPSPLAVPQSHHAGSSNLPQQTIPQGSSHASPHLMLHSSGSAGSVAALHNPTLHHMSQGAGPSCKKALHATLVRTESPVSHSGKTSSHHIHKPVTHSPLSRPKSCEPGSPVLRGKISPERLHPSSAVQRPASMGMDKLPPPHRKVSLAEKPPSEKAPP